MKRKKKKERSEEDFQRFHDGLSSAEWWSYLQVLRRKGSIFDQLIEQRIGPYKRALESFVEAYKEIRKRLAPFQHTALDAIAKRADALRKREDGLSYGQIAKLQGISRQAAHKRCLRAQKEQSVNLRG
jgi:hypothetical protein